MSHFADVSFKSKQDGENAQTKLLLESVHNLSGTLREAKAVRFPGAKKDSLLVSLSDAKCCILDWDADRHELVTISMHFYETDELKQGHSRFGLPPTITVDPQMRCSAMVVLDRHIAVLPFNDGGDALSTLYGWGTSRTAKTKDSWLLDCAQLGVNRLLDVVFLHNYFQPTLLVLYEDKPTWPGRALVTWNTRAVIAVTLDLTKRSWSVIWKCEGLGNDVYSAWAIPGPIGGAVLLGANAVHYVNQATRFSLIVNIHGSVNASQIGRINYWKSSKGVTLDAARLCVLNCTARLASCLLSDKYGVIHVLNVLVGDATMELAPVGAASIASCLTLVPGGYLFLGSRVGDSLLLRFKTRTESQPKRGGAEERAQKRARSTLNSSSAAASTTSTSTTTTTMGNDVEEKLYAELFSGSEVSSAAKTERGNVELDLVGEQDQEDLREAALKAEAEAQAREAHMDSTSALLDGGDIPPQATVSWELSVAELLVSVPITSMVVAPSTDPATLSNATEENDAGQMGGRHALDIVACSGAGRSGCVALLQRSIRPDHFTALDVGFVQGAWALYRSDSPYHQYLVLSRRLSTSVLSTATDDFRQLEAEECALSLNAPTVGIWTTVGPTGRPHERVVQVTKWAALLCTGHETRLQTIDWRTDALDDDGWAYSASFASGVLMVMRKSGQLVAWRYDPQVDQLVELPACEFTPDDPWTSCCVYAHPADAHPSWKTMSEEQATVQGLIREMRDQGKTQAEIEEMLGGPIADIFDSATRPEAGTEYVYSLVTRKSGIIEIWAIEDKTIKPVFFSTELIKGEALVTHEGMGLSSSERGAAGAGDGVAASSTKTTTTSGSVSAAAAQVLVIQEMAVFRSEDRGIPILFCMTSQNDLLVYKCIHSYADGNVLPLRLKRIQVNFVMRSHEEVSGIAASASVTGGDPMAEPGGADDELPYARQLILFNNICGRRGLFLRGKNRSGWCLLGSREYLNSVLEHNMHGEGLGLNAFTPFHYQSCRRGFITVSARGRLRIAQLKLGNGADENGEVQHSCVVRKVGLRSAEDAGAGYEVTPFFVAYHPPSQHFVVAAMASRQTHAVDAQPLTLPLVEEKWRLCLYRAGQWSLSDMLHLDEGEQVLSLKVLSLSRGDDKGPDRLDNQVVGTAHLPRKLYVVMGTGFVRNGEDTIGDPVTGNIRIYALVPTPDPLKPYQFKALVKEYVKGPVSQLCEMYGYLIYQVGPKTMMTLLGQAENVLVGKGFYDTQIYVTSLQATKNFIMFTDAYKSVYFLAWREDVRQLRILGKDFGQSKLVEGGFMVDYDAIAFVTFDEDGNCRCLKYDPGSIKTRDGTQLVLTSTYHLGTQISATARVVLHSLASDAMHNQAFYKRSALVASGLDGSVHLLVPAHEVDYRRLQLLQTQMNATVASEAGLNHMDYRTYRAYYDANASTNKSDDNNPIIDMGVVYRYLSLPTTKRRLIARRIGTHQRLLFKNALELELCTEFF